MRFEELLGVEKYSWFIFRCTNRCNLSCELCQTLDNQPIGSDSPYRNRRAPWEVSVEDLEKFCEVFEGIGDNGDNLHRITGGEPTTLPTDKLEEIIDVFHSHNRSLSLITNGYNIMGLDKAYINKIDLLVLDNHGINQSHINDCARFLKGFYKGKLKRVKVLYHYDCTKAKNDPRNIGKCSGGCSIPKAPALFEKVIYPCPAFEFIEELDGHTKITDSLKEAGWTLDNPEILETMRNWRNSIPQYALDQCMYNCWYPNIGLGGKHRITLKPNDIIKKRT